MTESTNRAAQQSKQTRSFMSPTTANGTNNTKEDIPQRQSAWSKPLPPPVPKVVSSQKASATNHHVQRQLHFGSIPATTLDLSLPPRTQSAPPNLDELNNITPKQSHPNQSSTTAVPIPSTLTSSEPKDSMSASVGHQGDSLMNINPNRKYSVPFLDSPHSSNPQPPKDNENPVIEQSQPPSIPSKLTHQAPSFYPKSGPYPPNMMHLPQYYPPNMMPMMPVYPYPPPPPQFGIYGQPVTTTTQSSSSFIVPPKKASKAITIKDPTTGEPIKLNEVPIFNKPPTSPSMSEATLIDTTAPSTKEKDQAIESVIDQINELKIENVPSITIIPEYKESSDDDDEVSSMSITTLEEGEIKSSIHHIKYPSNGIYSKELLLSFQPYEFIPYDSPDGPPFIPDSITELLEQGSPNYYYSSGANRYMSRRTSYRTDKPMHRRSSSPRSVRRSSTKRLSKTPDSLDVLLPVSMNRWIRPDLKTSNNMEKIFRFVKGSLNKLTAENFDRITRKMIDSLIPSVQILTDSYQRLESQLKDEPIEDVSPERSEMEAEATSIISETIQIIFDKAVDEPNFSPLYAMTCTRIVQSNELPVVPMKMSSTGMIQPISLFKRLLLSKCQEEFEKKVAWTKERMEKQDTAIDTNQSTDGLNAEELEYQRLKLKRRTLGNISFIGHLYMQGLLREQIIHNCIRDLLSTTEEEEIECCCKMLTTSGSMLDTTLAKKVMNAYFKRLQELSSDSKMSSRLRFMIMDLMDLREAGWDKKRATELGKQNMTGDTEKRMEPPPGLDHPVRHSDYRSSSNSSLRSTRSSSTGLSDRQGYNRQRNRPPSRQIKQVIKKDDTFQQVTRGKKITPADTLQDTTQSTLRSSNAFDALVEQEEKESIDNTNNVMSIIQSIILESPSKADLEDMTSELEGIANDTKNSIARDWIVFKFFSFVLDKNVKEIEKSGKYIGKYYLNMLDQDKQILAMGVKRLFDVYDDWKQDIPKIDHVIGLLLGSVLMNSEESFAKQCLAQGDESLPVIIPNVKSGSNVTKEMIGYMNNNGFKLDECKRYLEESKV